MVWAYLAIILLILYIAFDVNYFIRVLFLIGLGPIFKKKSHIFGTTTIGGTTFFIFSYGLCIIFLSSYYVFKNCLGWCTTQDLDIFMRHMNNSRYLRDLDFARYLKILNFHGLLTNYVYETSYSFRLDPTLEFEVRQL